MSYCDLATEDNLRARIKYLEAERSELIRTIGENQGIIQSQLRKAEQEEQSWLHSRDLLHEQIKKLEAEVSRLRELITRRSGASSWEEWTSGFDLTEETPLEIITRLRELNELTREELKLAREANTTQIRRVLEIVTEEEAQWQLGIACTRIRSTIRREFPEGGK